jgi:hypothetical protein
MNNKVKIPSSENVKKITDYFRASIFDSYGAYSAWKMIRGSRSITILGKQMADKYVGVQKIHGDCFVVFEKALLFHFVVLVLHPFDTDPSATSLYKVDRKKTEEFVKANLELITNLKLLRNKVFAHKEYKCESDNTHTYKVPSFDHLDNFFKSLIIFYNNITSEKLSSNTIFDNAPRIKTDIEYLLMNIDRGESVRKKEIEIKYGWKERDRKASDLL